MPRWKEGKEKKRETGDESEGVKVRWRESWTSKRKRRGGRREERYDLTRRNDKERRRACRCLEEEKNLKHTVKYK